MRSPGVVALLVAALAAPAAEAPPILPVQPEVAVELFMAPADGPAPGRVDPAAPAEPVAFRIQWDEYVSLLVVGEAAVQGKAVRRPAWVVTYDTSEAVVVAYRATAYRDAKGTLHFDARKAIISGPQCDRWSPDSFSIGSDGAVRTLDDGNRGHGGTVMERTEGVGDAYRRLLQIAMAIVRDVS